MAQQQPKPGRRSVAVIGGGISGLVAAHRIREQDPDTDVVLLESGSQLGGVLHTEERDGFLIEHGAENFITTVPGGVELCKHLGLESELVPTNAAHRQAFVLRRGKLLPIPPGFAMMAPSRVWPMLATRILTPWGKARLAAEWFVRSRDDDEDESLASFVTRRMGREVYARLVQPLIGGIYTGDPEKLSVDATMPRFREMERKHGSLVRALRKQARAMKHAGSASGARYSQFVALRRGMSTLVDALAGKLPASAIHLNSGVERIYRQDQRWRVEVQGTPDPLEVDGIVLAAPAHQAARLARELDESLANMLTSIELGSCALVTFGFRRDQIKHPLNGFGFVVPSIERRQILSASFSSVKYPGRAPEGHVLIRAYLGGAMQKHLLRGDDDALASIAQNELSALLQIKGTPVVSHIKRQTQAMPQYYVGHQKMVAQIESRVAALPGLVLTGNAYRGVGIPPCITTAQQAADQLVRHFAARQYSVPTVC